MCEVLKNMNEKKEGCHHPPFFLAVIFLLFLYVFFGNKFYDISV